MQKIEILLERIAVALERVADALENKPKFEGRELQNKGSVEIVPAVSEELVTPSQVLPTIEDEDALANYVSSDTEEFNDDLLPRTISVNYAKLYPHLSKFLESRSIEISGAFTPMEPLIFDEQLDDIAYFMGKNYKDVAELLTQVKLNLRSGANFVIDLGVVSAPSRQIIYKLCSALYEMAFFDEYKRSDYPGYRINLRANNIGIVHNFFSGFWFERYVAQEVIKVVKEFAQEINISVEDFELIRNVRILCENGQIARERDLLCYFNGEHYWFECKSGGNYNYVDSISSYESFADTFKLKPENCFLVFLSNEVYSHKSANLKMNICSSADFRNKLKEVLRKNTRS